jgi:hypothetical protein
VTQPNGKLCEILIHLNNSFFKSIGGNVNQSVVGEQAYFAMYKMNKNGPKTEPCGKPSPIPFAAEFFSPNLVSCVRTDK